MVEKFSIYICNVATCGAVHKYRIEDIHLNNLILDIFGCGRNFGISQKRLHIGDIESAAVENALFGVCKTHHAEFERLFANEIVALLAYLVHEAHAHISHAGDKEVEHLGFRKEEAVVNHIQSLAQISEVDNERDVGFGSTLSTSYYIDTISAKSIKQAAGNARSVLHIFAHNSHCGEVLLGGDVADIARA